MLIFSVLLYSSPTPKINGNPVHLPCLFYRCNVSCPSVSSVSCSWPLQSLPSSLLDSFLLVSHSLAVKQRQLCRSGQEEGVISELRPSQKSLKAGLMTESFFLPRAGFRWNSCGLGTVPRVKIDVQGYGPSLVKVEAIQLILGLGGDKAHLFCCYEAYICPLLQHKSPAGPASLWDTPAVRCLTPTLGGSLRVCGSNDTHLRDDTAKYLSAYIKIAASLEKKK